MRLSVNVIAGIVILILVVGLLDALSGFPLAVSALGQYQTWFGPHRAFYQACRGLEHSESLGAARRTMANYREISDSGFVHGISEEILARVVDRVVST